MYPDDWKFHKILWYFNFNDTLNIYELNTVTYGLVSSVFQTLRKLAIDERDKFGKGARLIFENIYVYDAFFGVESILEAANLSRKFIECLKMNGCSLQKWSANSSDLLSHIPHVSLKDNFIEVSTLTNIFDFIWIWFLHKF